MTPSKVAQNGDLSQLTARGVASCSYFRFWKRGVLEGLRLSPARSSCQRRRPATLSLQQVHQEEKQPLPASSLVAEPAVCEQCGLGPRGTCVLAGFPGIQQTY